MVDVVDLALARPQRQQVADRVDEVLGLQRLLFSPTPSRTSG
jgi:hypothetical protein